MAVVTVALPAQCNSIDTSGGSSTAVMNIDLRQQPNAGGFFNFEAAASAVAGLTTGARTVTLAQGGAPTLTAPYVTIPATLTIMDSEGGSATSTVFVDLRQQANEGGSFHFEVATSALAGFAAGACTVSIS
jgi:hypothetical protein